MSSSNIIFQMEYKYCKNKRNGISRWMDYASKKQNADSSSIDDYNLLKDYALFSDKETYLNESNETFLWSKNGDVLKQDALFNFQDKSKGFFWRGFVSFPPDFAIEHGLITKVDYYSLSNNFITSLILDMGLDLNNVNWYCSLHRNTKNPHIHFCIFEKKVTKGNPMYPKYCISKCKSNIANYLIDYEKFYKLRDETFSNVTNKINLNDLNMIKRQRLFSDKYRSTLNKMLLEFYNDLPKKGRLQYNSKNMVLYKNKLDNIIEYILMHDSVKYEYTKYIKLLDEHQKELNNVYGSSDANKNKKYFNDQKNRLYSKIGNEILNNFKIYQSLDVLEKEKNFLQKHINELKFKSRSDYSNATKETIASELYKLCNYLNLNNLQTKKVFNRWIRNSNYKFDADYLLETFSLKYEKFDSRELYRILKRLGYDYNRYQKIKEKNFYRELNYKRFINKAVDHLLYELEREEKEIINELQYEIDSSYNN